MCAVVRQNLAKFSPSRYNTSFVESVRELIVAKSPNLTSYP
jgi:hypothetical protein